MYLSLDLRGIYSEDISPTLQQCENKYAQSFSLRRCLLLQNIGNNLSFYIQ